MDWKRGPFSWIGETVSIRFHASKDLTWVLAVTILILHLRGVAWRIADVVSVWASLVRDLRVACFFPVNDLMTFRLRPAYKGEVSSHENQNFDIMFRWLLITSLGSYTLGSWRCKFLLWQWKSIGIYGNKLNIAPSYLLLFSNIKTFSKKEKTFSQKRS